MDEPQTCFGGFFYQIGWFFLLLLLLILDQKLKFEPVF